MDFSKTLCAGTRNSYDYPYRASEKRWFSYLYHKSWENCCCGLNLWLGGYIIPKTECFLSKRIEGLDGVSNIFCYWFGRKKKIFQYR